MIKEPLGIDKPPRTPVSVFVTGTDTGVGKTRVCVALLQALAVHHPRVVGMKPIAAGTTLIHGIMVHEDVIALRAASNYRVAPQLDSPVVLADPLSPHLAAERAGVSIDIASIIRCHRKLLALANVVVVEGAGGFLVPLSRTQTGADLACALDLPVVLTVGVRLGCLNHALLTAEAIRARGLTLIGWVANQIDPHMKAQADNIAFLQATLNAPLLATLPHGVAPLNAAPTFDLPQAWR